jgi:hypothetical protein
MRVEVGERNWVECLSLDSQNSELGEVVTIRSATLQRGSHRSVENMNVTLPLVWRLSDKQRLSQSPSKG